MTEAHCIGTIKFNGEECPVTNLFDLVGNETKDPTKAVTAVIVTDRGLCLVIEIDSEPVRPLQ